MKKFLLILVFGIFHYQLFAQTAEDALSEFDWLTNYVERNYPGYKLKTQGKEVEWKKYVYSQRQIVATQPDTLPIILDNYLKRFNDRHLYLRLANKTIFEEIIQREKLRQMQQQGLQSHSVNMYYTAKAMNDSTFFLRIPSFDSNTSNKIVDENFEAITSRPYLIIDIRSNSGGDDANFESLLSLIYSQPYLTHGTELYATEDFLNMYRDIVKKNPNEKWVDFYKRIVAVIEENSGEYVLRPDSKRIDMVKRDTVYHYPKRVGILIHRQNASSAEQFIIEARESEKVVLFGNENTSGTIDLSNVYRIESPLKWFRLHIPTTRSCRWPDIVIDGRGLAPQIPIPYKESLQEKDNIGDEILYVERILRGINPANQ